MPQPIATPATITERLAEALRNMPDDGGMIENSPDGDLRLACCDGQVVHCMVGSDRVDHDVSCWYVAAREALAAFDAIEGAARRIAACVSAFDGIPVEAIEGIQLTGPVREIWCSTDSCSEHWGWENVDEVPDWAPRDVSSVRTTFTATARATPG